MSLGHTSLERTLQLGRLDQPLGVRVELGRVGRASVPRYPHSQLRVSAHKNGICKLA